MMCGGDNFHNCYGTPQPDFGARIYSALQEQFYKRVDTAFPFEKESFAYQGTDGMRSIMKVGDADSSCEDARSEPPELLAITRPDGTSTYQISFCYKNERHRLMSFPDNTARLFASGAAPLVNMQQRGFAYTNYLTSEKEKLTSGALSHVVHDLLNVDNWSCSFMTFCSPENGEKRL